MSAMDCETARDLLPSLHGAGLSTRDRASLEAHVAGCDDCRADAELIAMLRRNPATPPAGLFERIVDGLPVRRPGQRRAVGLLALAATLAGALVVGRGLVQELLDVPAAGDPAANVEPPVGLLQSFWPADDGLVAGIAPALHQLSVDELEMLLAELDS
ncbi:MAG TPA: zf-HC2 domain-containing protein [Longimicrobiales bacterium]